MDPSQFPNVVEALRVLSGHSTSCSFSEADNYLIATKASLLRDFSTGWSLSEYLLTQAGENLYIAHYALQIQVDCIKSCNPGDSAAFILRFLQMFSSFISPGRFFDNVVVNKIVEVFSELGKREWPANWPTMISDMQQCGGVNPFGTSIVMLCISRLISDCSAISVDKVNGRRRREALQGLIKNFERLVDMVAGAIFTSQKSILALELVTLSTPETYLHTILENIHVFIAGVDCLANLVYVAPMDLLAKYVNMYDVIRTIWPAMAVLSKAACAVSHREPISDMTIFDSLVFEENVFLLTGSIPSNTTKTFSSIFQFSSTASLVSRSIDALIHMLSAYWSRKLTLHDTSWVLQMMSLVVLTASKTHTQSHNPSRMVPLLMKELFSLQATDIFQDLGIVYLPMTKYQQLIGKLCEFLLSSLPLLIIFQFHAETNAPENSRIYPTIPFFADAKDAYVRTFTEAVGLAKKETFSTTIRRYLSIDLLESKPLCDVMLLLPYLLSSILPIIVLPSLEICATCIDVLLLLANDAYFAHSPHFQVFFSKCLHPLILSTVKLPIFSPCEPLGRKKLTGMSPVNSKAYSPVFHLWTPSLGDLTIRDSNMAFNNDFGASDPVQLVQGICTSQRLITGGQVATTPYKWLQVSASIQTSLKEHLSNEEYIYLLETHGKKVALLLERIGNHVPLILVRLLLDSVHRMETLNNGNTTYPFPRAPPFANYLGTFSASSPIVSWMESLKSVFSATVTPIRSFLSTARTKQDPGLMEATTMLSATMQKLIDFPTLCPNVACRLPPLLSSVAQALEDPAILPPILMKFLTSVEYTPVPEMVEMALRSSGKIDQSLPPYAQHNPTSIESLQWISQWTRQQWCTGLSILCRRIPKVVLPHLPPLLQEISRILSLSSTSHQDRSTLTEALLVLNREQRFCEVRHFHVYPSSHYSTFAFLHRIDIDLAYYGLFIQIFESLMQPCVTLWNGFASSVPFKDCTPFLEFLSQPPRRTNTEQDLRSCKTLPPPRSDSPLEAHLDNLFQPLHLLWGMLRRCGVPTEGSGRLPSLVTTSASGAFGEKLYPVVNRHPLGKQWSALLPDLSRLLRTLLNLWLPAVRNSLLCPLDLSLPLATQETIITLRFIYSVSSDELTLLRKSPKTKELMEDGDSEEDDMDTAIEEVYPLPYLNEQLQYRLQPLSFPISVIATMECVRQWYSKMLWHTCAVIAFAATSHLPPRIHASPLADICVAVSNLPRGEGLDDSPSNDKPLERHVSTITNASELQCCPNILTLDLLTSNWAQDGLFSPSLAPLWENLVLCFDKSLLQNIPLIKLQTMSVQLVVPLICACPPSKYSVSLIDRLLSPLLEVSWEKVTQLITSSSLEDSDSILRVENTNVWSTVFGLVPNTSVLQDTLEYSTVMQAAAIKAFEALLDIMNTILPPVSTWYQIVQNFDTASVPSESYQGEENLPENCRSAPFFLHPLTMGKLIELAIPDVSAKYGEGITLTAEADTVTSVRAYGSPTQMPIVAGLFFFETDSSNLFMKLVSSPLVFLSSTILRKSLNICTVILPQVHYRITFFKETGLEGRLRTSYDWLRVISQFVRILLLGYIQSDNIVAELTGDIISFLLNYITRVSFGVAGEVPFTLDEENIAKHVVTCSSLDSLGAITDNAALPPLGLEFMSPFLSIHGSSESMMTSLCVGLRSCQGWNDRRELLISTLKQIQEQVTCEDPVWEENVRFRKLFAGRKV